MIRATFAEELRGEEDCSVRVLLLKLVSETDRDSGLHHNVDLRINTQCNPNDVLHTGGIEEVCHRVIVRRCSHDEELRVRISLLRISGCVQRGWLGAQVLRELNVLNRRLKLFDQFHALRIDIYRYNIMVLRQKSSIGQADIAKASDSDFHGNSVLHQVVKEGI